MKANAAAETGRTGACRLTLFRAAVIVAVAATWAPSSAEAQIPTPTPDSARRVAPPKSQALPSDTALRVTGDSVARRGALSRPLRVCAGGDVTLGTNIDTAWARKAHERMRAFWQMRDDPDSLLAPLKPLVSGADVVLLNVEGAIGEGNAPRKCRTGSLNCFAFRQPVGAARALRQVAESAAVVGNVANNHSHDAGASGLVATVAHLKRAGVLVTGADTLATPVVAASGDTIGVLGFRTSNETPDARNLTAVRRHVARAVDRFGVVIVTMHLGAEGRTAQRTRDTTEIFLKTIDRGNPVAFANAAIDAGATLVVGHGPHVLRAAEWRGTRLVFYSLGNLVNYGPFGLDEPMRRGAVACVTIDSAGVVSQGELRSTVQLAPGILRADSTGRAARLVDSLSLLDFPRSGAVIDSTGAIRARAETSLSRPR